MPVFSRHLIVTIVRLPGTPQEYRQENVRAGGTVDTNALFYPDTDIKRGDEIHAAHLDEPRVVTAVHPKTVLSGELTHYEVELEPVSINKERQVGYNQRSTPRTFLRTTSSKEGSQNVQIFLCHANEDKSQVRVVYQRLKAAGFHPWLDEEDLLPGQLWDQEIRRALRNSDFILIFFSQNSVAKRGYVQREMKLALDTWEEVPEGQIHTIPVRLDDCTIPERFKRFQWVNLFAERGFERIVHAIQAGLLQRQQLQRVAQNIWTDAQGETLQRHIMATLEELQQCAKGPVLLGGCPRINASSSLNPNLSCR